MSRYNGAGNNTKTRLICLVIILVLLIGTPLAYPSVFQLDIGYKNQLINNSAIHPIPASELGEVFADFSTHLPIIYISAERMYDRLFTDWSWSPDGPAYPPKIPTTGTIYSFENEINRLSDTPTTVMPDTRIKLRGRTTSYDGFKRPYSLNFKGSKGEPRDVSFLGLPPDSNFTMRAPWMDKSCLRDYMAFALAGEMLDYTPRCTFAEVFVNQAGEELVFQSYRGIYLITEKAKAGENRVPINEFILKSTLEEQIAQGGGYIIRINPYEEELAQQVYLPETPNGISYCIVYPAEKNSNSDNSMAIYEEMCFYENIIKNGSFEDIQRYLDIDTFVDHMLLILYSLTYESYIGSINLYRLPGGKLSMGPVWDFEASMGNYTDERDFFFHQQSPFEEMFLARSEFKALLVQRWRELRQTGGTFNDDHVLGIFNSVADYVGDAAFTRNTERYPMLFSPDYGITANCWKFSHYTEELDMMREFFVQRGRWLDENIEYI